MKVSWVVLLVLIIILAAAAGYLGYSYLGLTGKPIASSTPAPVALVQQPAVNTYVGIVEPLPYSPNDPYRDPDGPPEGLKLDNGDFYALVGTIDANILVEGHRISVAGNVDPSVTISHYDVKGVIRVTRMSSI